MLPLALAALASVMLVGAQDNDEYHPHAAFAFVRTGERTPTIRPGSQVLTALGAQQMYQLGQNLRTRYIDGYKSGKLGIRHIEGLSAGVLRNDQVLVQTLDSPHLVHSAQAFMQGLYPPHSVASRTGTGDVTGLLANGTTIEYPLGGYQYPNILATNGPESIYVQGDQNCSYAKADAMKWFLTDEFNDSKEENKDIYQKLDLQWFEGNVDEDELDPIFALELYDYISYQYSHNHEIFTTLANDTAYTGIYDTLRHLADQEAWHLWGNTSHTPNAPNMRAMAGKTLAAAVLSQFQNFVNTSLSLGNKTETSNPLSLFFGEQQPFISLISLMELEKRDQNFKAIPTFGSAMLFELFSKGNSPSFPATQDELFVRFYFSNGTAYPNTLISYPMFDRGPSGTDIPWKEFESKFQEISVKNVSEWCSKCSSAASFCIANGESKDGNDDKDWNDALMEIGQLENHGLTPAVAGAIGAAVTLVLAGILFALAAMCGGVRLHRVQRNEKSELGGFKGSAKLASDPDVSMANNGAPPIAGIVGVGGTGKRGHERVGSWELRQKEARHGDLGDRSSRGSFEAIEAIMSRPVQPYERV